MSDVNDLISNARANEVIARNLFEIETEIMNITQCSSFFDQLLKMVRDKFSIEYAWVAIANTPANAHFVESLSQVENGADDAEPLTDNAIIEPCLKRVAMIDFLQITQSTRQPLLRNERIPQLRAMIPKAYLTMIQSLAILPLILEKKVVGALMLGSPDKERYSPIKDHFFLEQLSVKVSLSLIGVWARERVSFLATRDPLTHLRNRRELEESLEQELSRHMRQRCHLALMFIDCDDFKQVNDEYGHETGDLYLKHVAEQLVEQTRKSDLVFRFAGDEFVILLPNQTQEGADIISARIREHVQEKLLKFDGNQVPVKLSYGVVSTETLQSFDGKALLKAADQRLYAMKALKPSSRKVIRTNTSEKSA